MLFLMFSLKLIFTNSSENMQVMGQQQTGEILRDLRQPCLNNDSRPGLDKLISIKSFICIYADR